MDYSKIEEKWNEVFLQFLDELNTLFPSCPAKKFKTQFNLSRLIKNTPPIVIFLDGVQEHGKEIMDSNEKYFFENKIWFVDHLELRKYYSLASKENREIIWKYIQTLYLLSDGYSNKKLNLNNYVQQTV